MAPSSSVFDVLSHLLPPLCSGGGPSHALKAVLPYLGQQLQCDRVFLYLRSPHSSFGRVPFCWRRHADIPEIYDAHWKLEPETLAEDDPMFAAALELQPSLFIDDVETANPAVLNRQFEQTNFGHRALIHGHLGLERQLWGVLQPCIFDEPRIWNQQDRQLIQHAVAWLTPLALEYVLHHHPFPS